MKLTFKHRLIIVSIVYWVLLLYILSALLWWFIALNHQNDAMATLKLQAVNTIEQAYLNKTADILREKQRKTAQYIGEGLTFLAIILIGAAYVYRATRRQIKLAQQQQNFMMAVTHELKTPIAVAQLNLETLQKRKLDPTIQEKLVNNTLQETNRLNTLCNNILFTSQLESGHYHASPQKVNFSDLVQNAVKDATARFAGRTIVADITQGVNIMGEPLLLQMLMNNLIENALKYSPKQASVTVQLKQQNQHAVVAVIDEGMGISAEEKKKIFRKFYRTGDENVRSTKGTGLGLYLCKKIAQQHHATIQVLDNLPNGSIFKVIFAIA
ncbi:sensor histidine kinase [Hydrotalea sandarakina]|jgi:two-component system sensor histidine kinase CiaH|uniref:histidine kinase n=1 Tax=Hydrotalea sandarakina TaxID=1004304 RepID=A0A2W7RNG0_9BACT|nr:ATP-binding protein [Hydrotalea sandarakina]PZX62338.1 phospho-acceptor domain-containing protein [Hydrotalea sandarakina]